MPFAEGDALRFEIVGIGQVGFVAVDGVKVEHGARDVAFVVFARFEALVVGFAIPVDIFVGDGRLGHGQIKPTVGLCVGDFGERQVGAGGVDGDARRVKVVHIGARIAGVGPFGARPGVFGIDAPEGVVLESPHGRVGGGVHVERMPGVYASEGVVARVDAAEQGVAGVAKGQNKSGAISLTKIVDQGRAFLIGKYGLMALRLAGDRKQANYRTENQFFHETTAIESSFSGVEGGDFCRIKVRIFGRFKG